MNNDARKAPRDSIDDGKHESRSQKGVTSDAHLAGRGVGQELNVLHAERQVVEYGQAAVEECAAILGWLNSLAIARDKPNAKNVLQLDNRRAGSMGSR